MEMPIFVEMLNVKFEEPKIKAGVFSKKSENNQNKFLLDDTTDSNTIIASKSQIISNLQKNLDDANETIKKNEALLLASEEVIKELKKDLKAKAVMPSNDIIANLQKTIQQLELDIECMEL